MQIRHFYRQKKPVISFEVFPPKKDGALDTVLDTLDQLAGLRPDYISVTYGAGGGGAVNRTCEIASAIKHRCDVEPLAHLTCKNADKPRIHQLLDELAANGIRNILAMRGDITPEEEAAGGYRYASQLIRDIADRGDFCVAGACYPEGHIDAQSVEQSILHLREKQEAGADFFISQLFFDNDLFWRFLEQARAAGVTLPISAGVMPILSRGQIERMIFLCGASLPSAIIKLLHKYESNAADLRSAGIEYAVRQMEQLVQGGADGVHVYTMNHPDIAETVMERIGSHVPRR